MDFKDIPDRREEGETPLAQAQLVMLRILLIFDRICKKHGFEYWLDAGTLLGAVRHGGFIPWDDDLDVCMMREDYLRFCRVVQQELPEDLFFQTTETEPNYREYHGKIRDRYSTILEDPKDHFHQGIFIDIFPMEALSEDEKQARREAGFSKFLYLFKHRMTSSEHWYYLVLKRMFNLAGMLIPSFLINGKINSIRKRYTLNEKSHISYGLDSFYRNVFPAAHIFPLDKMNFEGYSFPVPRNLHDYLCELFGPEYGQLPPKEHQSQHALSIDPFHSSGYKESLDWSSRS